MGTVLRLKPDGTNTYKAFSEGTKNVIDMLTAIGGYSTFVEALKVSGRCGRPVELRKGPVGGGAGQWEMGQVIGRWGKSVADGAGQWQMRRGGGKRHQPCCHVCICCSPPVLLLFPSATATPSGQPRMPHPRFNTATLSPPCVKV